jgi:hypothetical protein
MSSMNAFSPSTCATPPSRATGVRYPTWSRSRCRLAGKRGVPLTAELLAEVEVPARLLWNEPPFAHISPAVLDGVEDAAVARAPANVPVERLGDRIPIAGLPLVDEM